MSTRCGVDGGVSGQPLPMTADLASRTPVGGPATYQRWPPCWKTSTTPPAAVLPDWVRNLGMAWANSQFRLSHRRKMVVKQLCSLMIEESDAHTTMTNPEQQPFQPHDPNAPLTQPIPRVQGWRYATQQPVPPFYQPVPHANPAPAGAKRPPCRRRRMR